jgi:hypothetical protein
MIVSGTSSLFDQEPQHRYLLLAFKGSRFGLFVVIFLVLLNKRNKVMSTVIRRKVCAPKSSYLDLVAKESVQLETPITNQLLILDLNGTLVSRVNRNKSMYVRPYSQVFFDYIFDNFKVMLWSSAQPHSVKNMSFMFGDKQEKFLAVWDRKSFGLSETDYRRKVVTIKDLDQVWKHFDGKYNATNTILLDDSPKKAQMQPYNCVHPTEFEHLSQAFVSSGESELLHVMDYLKKLQFQTNVANYIKHHPYHELLKDDTRNIYQVEHYIFSEAAQKGPVVVDLQPKEEVDVLTSKMSKVSL